ncbi:hypothetical protein A5320_04145 [Rheinheimera sp. SA_1]|uniref:DUF3034 family protein n=1 Tax=Rheinheimera sp. SA_1 TaxID=1827365 RepID=UPI0008007DF3|nr:DUF3034 family protein [Rheinheimera sp. SA_1]OBP16594.1 hypothetical protein A5320_04145 [Rheinheimera sp. SA_1]
MKLLMCALLGVLLSQPAVAGSKVIATGGSTSIEGAAGGGIVPWAVINGYASSGQWSVNSFTSSVGVDDFTLQNFGIGASYNNQWEVSLTRQKFQLDTIGGDLQQDVFGLKYHIAGELLYTSLPQISVGLQYKKHRNSGLPLAVGAQKDSGTDIYLAASKVYFGAVAGRNLLLNATVRATKANQIGLLGFGGADHNHYQYMFESSAAVLLRPDLAVGIEFRQKPNNLAFADEEHWRDIFVGWFINQNFSVVGGYVDLGSIAGLAQQQGYYLALEATF